MRTDIRSRQQASNVGAVADNNVDANFFSGVRSEIRLPRVAQFYLGFRLKGR